MPQRVQLTRAVVSAVVPVLLLAGCSGPQSGTSASSSESRDTVGLTDGRDDLAELSTRIDDLNSAIDELDGRVDDLETQPSGNDLQDAVDEVASNVDDLCSQINRKVDDYIIC